MGRILHIQGIWLRGRRRFHKAIEHKFQPYNQNRSNTLNARKTENTEKRNADPVDTRTHTIHTPFPSPVLMHTLAPTGKHAHHIPPELHGVQNEPAQAAVHGAHFLNQGVSDSDAGAGSGRVPAGGLVLGPARMMVLNSLRSTSPSLLVSATANIFLVMVSSSSLCPHGVRK